jgi:hypothetical protein
MANCPKCERPVTHVTIEDVEAKAVGGSPSWRGISYSCPWCRTILSVGIDPVALKTDTISGTVAGVLAALKRQGQTR